jgi:hypothetical protein
MKTPAALLVLLVATTGCTSPPRRAAMASHPGAFVRDTGGRVRAAQARLRDTIELHAGSAYVNAWLACVNRAGVRLAVRWAQEAYVDTMTYEQISRVTDADALRLVMEVNEKRCGPRPGASSKEP